MKIPMTDDCTPFMPVNKAELSRNQFIMAGATHRCRICKSDHLVVAYLNRGLSEPPNEKTGVPSELLFQYCVPNKAWILVGLYGRRMRP
jgi:hypothetical protein